MIATLTGRLTRKSVDYLIVDVSGVGYQVAVPLSTYYLVPDNGGEVSLHIHTHLREDSLSLFGFLTEAEKEMFLLLLAVSGIGPKLALAVLSTLSVQEISHAIQSSDDSRLCTIPGIGKKTAARMGLELKDKIARVAPTTSPAMQPVPSSDTGDAVSALVNLGYKKPLAEEAVRQARCHGTDQTVEQLIREALQALMRR
jgi:Holliday junction DNA helicase RuvA